MSCPNVSALKKKVIKKVMEKFNSLDKKKYPFELTKKNLTKEINKVKSNKFLNTLGSAKNSCAIRGGRYGKRGGGLLAWLLYILCIINQPDDFIDHVIMDYPDCSELLVPNDGAVASPTVAPSVGPEVVTAVAPSSDEDLHARLPTPEEVDAMSSEDYANYINSLGGGRRKRKSRKKRRRKGRKTKRKNMRKKKGGVPGKNKKIGKKTSKKKSTQRKERRVRFIECKTDANCDGTKICRGGICVEQREIPRVGTRSYSGRRALRRQRRLSGTAPAAAASATAEPTAAAAPAVAASAAAPPPQLTRTDSIRYQVGPDFGRSRSWADIERLLANSASKSNRGGRKTKRRR